MTTLHRTLSLVVVCVGLAGCRSKTAPAEHDEHEGTPPFLPSPAIPEAMHFLEVKDLAGIGIPRGCRLEPPLRRVRLPDASVRLLASRADSIEIALALDSNKDGRVDSAGLMPVNGSPPRPVPWSAFDELPVLGRDSDGWFLLQTVDGDDGLSDVWVWRERAAAARLATGAELTAWDAECAGSRCVALTSPANPKKESGASVFIGRSASSPKDWKRVDVRPAGSQQWTPLSIVHVSEDHALVALESSGGAELWAVTDHDARRVAAFPSKHGTYDVLASDPPVAVTAGSAPEACATDLFELLLVAPDGGVRTAAMPVAPESITARRLAHGFFLAWIAPASCRRDSRTMVFSLLTDTKGAPVSSTMAVGDAASFAVAARGDEVDLWLQKPTELLWVKARCRPEPGKTQPVSAPSSSR